MGSEAFQCVSGCLRTSKGGFKGLHRLLGEFHGNFGEVSKAFQKCFMVFQEPGPEKF